jgi:2-methylcitrate dehydratase PrpD
MRNVENTGETDVSARLAQFVVESRIEDLPPEALRAAKRSLLNFFATAIAGCREDVIERALGVLYEFSGPRRATVIGRSERMDVLNAAFVNAASGNVHDFDDTHIPTIIHPTAPIAPALLALAEIRPLSGRDFLHAFVLGVEVACRIGNAISPGHYRKGWHITSTCGVFGAAVAVGKVLRLDPTKIVHALGNASAQSGGLVETLGFMAKSLSVGNAARNGLLSALLAERGFVGPDRPLEGTRGFMRVVSETLDLSKLTSELGRSWEILANTFKPYPCGVVLNPVIDACLALHGRRDVDLERIERIVVSGHPLLRERTDRPGIASGREAQVSAQHSVAVTLVKGAAGLAEFTDAAVHDPTTRALSAKVVLTDDPAMPVGAATVTIEMLGSPPLRHHVAEARGSLERPLSDAELEQKLIALAAHGWPGCDTARLTQAIWAIDRSDDASLILQAARET